MQPFEKARINPNELFLNADPGFDGEDFHKACESEKIIPNIKPNPRNNSTLKDLNLIKKVLMSSMRSYMEAPNQRQVGY